MAATIDSMTCASPKRATRPTEPGFDVACRSDNELLRTTTTRQPAEQLEVVEPAHEAPASRNAAEDESRYPTGSILWISLLVMMMTIGLVGLDSSILATAVPSITDEFKTIADVGWYSAAFRLTLCAFQFCFGRMYTVWSAKRVFLACLVIFEVGSLLCAVSPNSTSLVFSRAVQGLGCSGLVSGCFVMLTHTYPLRRRPLILGAICFFEELCSAVSPLLGGVLASHLSWRWCFYINLPLGFLAFVLTAVFYRSPIQSRHQGLPFKQKIMKLDLTGTAIFVPGIVSLLVGLQFGGTVFGWSDPRVIACFAVSAVLVGLFAWWQVRRQDEATLPPRIIKQRSIIAGMIFAGCNNSAISVVTYYLPIYFQTVMQLSSQQSGLFSLPAILSFMFSYLGGSVLTSAIGYYAPAMMTTSLVAPIACGLLSTLSVHSAAARIVGYQIMLGFASGIGFHGPQIAIQSVMDTADVSFGVACIQFSSSFVPALIIPTAQSIFTGVLQRDLAKTVPNFDPSMFSNIGLSDLKDHVQASQLAGTLLGFDRALMQTFYLPTALSCATVIGSLAIEWKNIKKLDKDR